MNGAGKAVGRQPFAPGGGVEEGAVHPVRGGLQNAVKLDGTGGHDVFPLLMQRMALYLYDERPRAEST
jgi:hypothetical protein